MNKIHLVCNAHLDPVWLWEWEEGAASAISTFRAAADLCEEFEGFIFNHNEALLYQWIEEYEPCLFKRIQMLVREKKWHIMGGWYLQPDCNMPSGESFVRQILYGKTYFKEKFGVEPKTAVNFDSFGHTRGLVQILIKSGYDSYLFMRPEQSGTDIPSEEFVWRGFDDSKILAHRLGTAYHTPLGQAEQRLAKWIKAHETKPVLLFTWGVGNHGGGPSRQDIVGIDKLIKEIAEYEIVHSTPDEYFSNLKETIIPVPEHAGSLRPSNVGCYVSQVRIKQKHRLLENELFMTEKMLSAASIQGLVQYPDTELKKAFYKLMTAQFHDILPGSSVQPVEESSIRLLDCGLEIAAELKAKAFFALSSGQEKAKDGTYPIFIYNPHPYKVEGIFECEFMLADQNWKDDFSMPLVYQGNRRLPAQPEKEISNLSIDWRKRVAFAAELEPSSMNRFDCRMEMLPKKPEAALKTEADKLVFCTDDLNVVINCKTGLIDRYRIKGVDYLKENSFQPVVFEDHDDSWASTRYSFSDIHGRFRLMTAEAGTGFSGITEKLAEPVRVIEDGAVRSIVEAVFHFGNSFICQRYKLPKHGTEIEVELRVYWNEKSKMLKLLVPSVFEDSGHIGQTAYGVEELPCDGSEAVSQKWCGIVSKRHNKMLSCINNGTYASDFKAGEMRLSLVRSPGYSALDLSAFGVYDRPILPQDRFSPRIDQGERLFNFWFNGGEIENIMDKIDRKALVYNEKPYALSFFPSGDGRKAESLIELGDETVQMTTFKKAEGSNDYIVRLFEPVGIERETVIRIPLFALEQKIKLGKFEIKTFKLDVTAKTISEVALTEA